MFVRLSAIAATLALLSAPADADFAKVEKQSEFLQLVNGKVLTRPWIRLKVMPDGRIEGRGARWDVTGSWTWNSGFFCRDLNWGGDDLGYNCQEVRVNDRRVRFTSDKGTGDSADFRLK